MPSRKRAYTLYSISRTIFEEAALAAVVLWLLPWFGINIPVWLLIVFMVAWAVYSCFISSLVEKVTDKAAAVGGGALIGIKCTTTTPLHPDGYVRVGNELWLAHSMSGDIDVEAEVVVVSIKRLTLLVKPSMGTARTVEDSVNCV